MGGRARDGLVASQHGNESPQQDLPVVLAVRDNGDASSGASGHGFYRAFGKRALDLAVLLVALPVWGPALLVLAAVLLIVQGRPLLYCSYRVGRHRREICVPKFRTMYEDADRRLAEVLTADAMLAREFEHFFKLQADPRVTRLGALLRRFSLDELPQVVSVLRGDMSLIGPRPVLGTEIENYYGDAADIVLAFRPGLSGLWQVSGRNLLSYEERVKIDLEYVRLCCFWQDVTILLRTVPTALAGFGAF